MLYIVERGVTHMVVEADHGGMGEGQGSALLEWRRASANAATK